MISEKYHTELLSMTRRFDIAMRALIRIATSDYRGNRSPESQEAETALREISEVE